MPISSKLLGKVFGIFCVCFFFLAFFGPLAAWFNLKLSSFVLSSSTRCGLGQAVFRLKANECVVVWPKVSRCRLLLLFAAAVVVAAVAAREEGGWRGRAKAKQLDMAGEFFAFLAVAAGSSDQIILFDDEFTHIHKQIHTHTYVRTAGVADKTEKFSFYFLLWRICVTFC